MSHQDTCNNAWIKLISTLEDGSVDSANSLLPDGQKICTALKGLETLGEKSIEERLKNEFKRFNNQVIQWKRNSRNFENEKLKTKTLESQNRKQLIGLSAGLPAAGAAGAGAVIGLPFLVKFVKSWIT